MSINLKNFVEEIEIKNLKNELNNINSYLYPNLDSAKILYQQAYLGKSKFKNISFKINYLKHTVICPLTIENEGNNNNLNFYGKPFSIFSKFDLEDSISNKIIDIFLELLNNFKIEKFSFVQEVKNNSLDDYLLKNKNKFESVFEDSIIDLSLSEKKIINGFSKGHKSSIQKLYPELNYEIIDFNNYSKNQIFEMMNLHIKVVGKRTRSLASWQENEKMILQKKGFLIFVKLKNEIISSSLYTHDFNTGTYFSSCSLRNYFGQYRNLTHFSIVYAIKYLQKINCKYFHMGTVRNLYSREKLSEKETNVYKFKRSFGGKRVIKVLFDKIPNTLLN